MTRALELLSRWASFLHSGVILWLLFTGRLLSWSPWAWGPQLAALALAVWARAAFARGQFSVLPDPRQPRLIESGPYRWIRHPMYAAAEIVLWSGVLRHLSVATVAAGLCALAVVIVRVRDEEARLRAGVPGYAEYARRTRRIVPFVF